MLILAIESSCDETSVAIVEDENVLSNIVATQIDVHKEFGGVFPEVASRLHIENINFVIKEALVKSEKTFADLDAIAVTQGPGLIGSLHVGMMAAKTLAWSLDLPLIPVHHIAGHIYANKLVGSFEYPLMALVVSGGHTELVMMYNDYEFEVIGKTQDDAVGEAYDKVARQLGLGYPGGPIIDKLAKQGQPHYTLPNVKTENPIDFSFSGLKSAVRQLMLREAREGRELNVNDVAYAFQHKAVETLMKRVKHALSTYDVKTFVLAGGVAANAHLRENVEALKQQVGDINILVPPLWACMDQAAMIGIAAFDAARLRPAGSCDISSFSNMTL
ncbi:tRNA threonylcarbamoyl adenosine modification protein TsaD [Erysipelothrix larvae]|uniref:tRNA N6-adenosine threonylcarbamoyltransferase n=1 Tax=Erysipelothrix larvae TaxID=1514105 RepID=A0A0X8GZ30_9FIRM|nr:tRNA (adenosine(37)-N6)-threonylcarbamoyltransferase complex transferase subunit TsaD [Erysipelothrix larvae]AMC93056.1 tRNA threonylcarbamoyl adenosine modification protein TsaD [Erysipelothrix larvae]